MRITFRQSLMAVFTALTVVLGAASTGACPFCSATSQTLTEEMNAADAVIIAKIVGKAQAKKDPDSAAQPLPGESKFEILEVIKGQQHVGKAKHVEALHFGDVEEEMVFLMTGMALPDLKWSTPIPLKPRAKKYVLQLLALPEKGADRLVFFQEHLEDEDAMLAQDSYDEFARAPYSTVKELKPRMQHDKLIEWIRDKDVSPSHRRLYFTMLGVCGVETDLAMLEEMMKSEDRRDKAGLDALIACYLTLKGPDGMPTIEELFLKNKKADYADTYAAIMAIRFHGQESDVISKERLLVGLRYMLERPDLADLVISDLARWEDWAVMERLIRLFKEADDTSSWVRVPVVNFLQAAGRQEGDVGKQALAAIDELEKVDPKAVKQAKSFAAFGILAQSKPQAKPETTDAAKTEPKESTTDKPKKPVAEAGEAEQAPVATSSSLPEVGAPPEPPLEAESPPKQAAVPALADPAPENPTEGQSVAKQDTGKAPAEVDVEVAAEVPVAAKKVTPSAEPAGTENAESGGGRKRIALLLGLGILLVVVVRFLSSGAARQTS
jgi:hypothetical protein